MTEKTNILSKDQVKFLELFSKNNNLSKQFYLTGGTALNEFYISYRYSEDLDFFSEEEVDPSSVISYLKSIKNQMKYKTFDINTSFNRNIIMLNLKENTLKLEFTYFPFKHIETRKIIDGVMIDSIKDIAVNKLFTIYQNPRSRDFMDLFMINNHYNFSINELTKLAKIKFDWHIDPIQLGSQFIKCTRLKDYPRLIKDLNEKDWQSYFLSEAKNLENLIIK